MLLRSNSAKAMPAKEAWASASPMNASPFDTTKAPTTAQATATISVASSARCMKGKVSGSTSSRKLALMRSGMDGEILRPDVERDGLGAVGGPQVRHGEDLGRGALGYDLPAEEDHPFEPLGRAVEVAGGDEDGHASLAQPPDECRELVGGRRVQALEGLVE